MSFNTELTTHYDEKYVGKPTYTLVKSCNMPEDIKAEALDIVATACEEYHTSNEMIAKYIKNNFDKKFGKTWHAVVGNAYGFEITYESESLLYLFESGETAILLWKHS